MDVKEAVSIALGYVKELFSGDELMNLALEEVELDHDRDVWSVTVGFSRSWDLPKGIVPVAAKIPIRRDYKVVRIDSKTGEVLSVKNRSVEPYAVGSS